MINVQFQPLSAGKQINSFKVPDATTGVSPFKPLIKFGITLTGVIVLVTEWSINTEPTICLEGLSDTRKEMFN